MSKMFSIIFTPAGRTQGIASIPSLLCQKAPAKMQPPKQEFRSFHLWLFLLSWLTSTADPVLQSESPSQSPNNPQHAVWSVPELWVAVPVQETDQHVHDTHHQGVCNQVNVFHAVIPSSCSIRAYIMAASSTTSIGVSLTSSCDASKPA